MRTAAWMVAVGLLVACSRDASSSSTEASAGSPSAVPEHATWLLDGSTDDRFVRVAKHLRGFDVAMVETGYRYTELYWAGKDANFGYAAYQLEKIATAVRNGTERRPKRAASARMLDGPLSEMKNVIASRDAAGFDAAFAKLTATCNACHEAERVPFIRVAAPAARQSPVGAPSQ